MKEAISCIRDLDFFFCLFDLDVIDSTDGRFLRFLLEENPLKSCVPISNDAASSF